MVGSSSALIRLCRQRRQLLCSRPAQHGTDLCVIFNYDRLLKMIRRLKIKAFVRCRVEEEPFDAVWDRGSLSAIRRADVSRSVIDFLCP